MSEDTPYPRTRKEGIQTSRLRRMAQILAFFSTLFMAPVSANASDHGDAERGAKLFKKCSGCHMVGSKARNRVGPHLNDLFDRKAAAIDGYRYSKDMKRAGADGLTWTIEKLDLYIETPKSLVTGTRMSFRGMKKPQDRIDVIAFLRQYSASPADIPESAPTIISAAPSDPELDAAILGIKGDPEYGEYLSSECVTCHQASGADEGIPSITGWPQQDFVIVMHAYKNEARPHPVMRLIARRLSDEEIASLAAHFEGVE